MLASNSVPPFLPEVRRRIEAAAETLDPWGLEAWGPHAAGRLQRSRFHWQHFLSCSESDAVSRCRAAPANKWLMAREGLRRLVKPSAIVPHARGMGISLHMEYTDTWALESEELW